MSRKRPLILAAVALSLLVPAACANSPTPAAQAVTITKVTYLTNFGTFGREAYAYVARDKGFFRAAGLDVTIEAGAPATNVKAIDAGQAQFAAVDFATALLQVAHGADLRAVAAIQQRTVAAIISLQGSGLTQPADLVGKTIGTAPNSVLQTLFPAYAKLAGFDPKSVKWRTSDPNLLPELLASGKVDAVAQYLLGTPSLEAAAHKATVTLPYSDQITDLYGAALVTTSGMITKNSSLVKRFTGALMKGLAYTVAHPEESGQIMHNDVPTTTAATATGEIRLMAPYTAAPTAGAAVGVLDPARVARSIAILTGVGLITSEVSPDQVANFTEVTKGSAK